ARGVEAGRAGPCRTTVSTLAQPGQAAGGGRTRAPAAADTGVKSGITYADLVKVSLLALVELLESGVFATVASVAFIQWRRHGGASAAWLFATFGVLAMIVPLSWITDPTEAGPGVGALRRLVIVLLALFPYLLY